MFHLSYIPAINISLVGADEEKFSMTNYIIMSLALPFMHNNRRC